MWFGVITLFPEILAALNFGITGRAQKEKLLSVQSWNPRDFTLDKHRSVDDKPYGGGPGMVMKAEPLQAAIQAARKSSPGKPCVIHLTPQGKMFNQKAAEALLAREHLILISGRYEGIDERLLEAEVDEEWSLGDFVLSGGELAAMSMIDAITRLIPGALGHEESVTLDSLSCGLLKYPQYTRPEQFKDVNVPNVLLSGNHPQIQRWRLKQSLGKTWLKRPDLLMKQDLNAEQITLLMEFITERSPKDF